MNWKLILRLSVFGVAMGVASLLGWTKGVEPLLWFGIFILYAWWIARNCERLYFLHGLLVSVLNGIWISVIHAAFYSLYVKNNPQVVEAFKSLPPSLDPRVLMLIIGPIVGVITGLVAGLFAYIACQNTQAKQTCRGLSSFVSAAEQLSSTCRQARVPDIGCEPPTPALSFPNNNILSFVSYCLLVCLWNGQGIVPNLVSDIAA